MTNCDAERVIYLVENYQGTRFNGVIKRQLLSAFVHTMFRDRMTVYHTPSIRDSFEWLGK